MPGSPAGPRTRIQCHAPPSACKGPSASCSGDVGTASGRMMAKGLVISCALASSRSPSASAWDATVALPSGPSPSLSAWRATL
eukprot:531162-Alexandrium_andersonii.AAC.1